MVYLTQELCELIGCIIGDGNIYDKRPFYVEITGHPESDLSYFKDFLLKTIEKELNYTAKIKLRSRAIRIRINNKEFVNFLKELGIPSGKGKFEKVRIPDKINKKSMKHIKYCIRGIFDTDGCAHFDKRKIYKRPYIRIELHMSNRKLLSQIATILRKMGIKTTMPEKNITLYINGKENAKKYLETIGFRNLRHIKRINSFYPELTPFNCALVAQLVDEKPKAIAS